MIRLRQSTIILAILSILLSLMPALADFAMGKDQCLGPANLLWIFIFGFGGAALLLRREIGWWILMTGYILYALALPFMRMVDPREIMFAAIAEFLFITAIIVLAIDSPKKWHARVRADAEAEGR